MKLILLIFFLASSVNGFGQNGGDPFSLSPHIIREKKVKSITEYNSEYPYVVYAKYDQYGNQIYHDEERQITAFELTYAQEGYLTEEVAMGYVYELLLKKRPVYDPVGKIDSIIYELPIGPYISGFVEKYHYDNEGRIKTIEVYLQPGNDLSFQHSYSYAPGVKSAESNSKANQVQKIRTYRPYGEESIIGFTKTFSYDNEGSLKKTTQLSEKGDTISVKVFGKDGLLLEEIVSHFCAPLYGALYSSMYYSEAMEKLQTPLTPLIIVDNLNRDNDQETELMHVEHQYENDQLLKSTKSVMHKGKKYPLSADIYAYDDQNKLIERLTINSANGDSTTVRFTYDQTQQHIHLSENSRSYLTISNQANAENMPEELVVEAFRQRWECKTIRDYDSIASTVTKSRFCKDSEDQYPDEPQQITVARFDSNGNQLNQDTFFGGNGESRNTAYEYSENGELVRYEFNGQYWKYIYNSDDSTLLKQEHYTDSLYETLEFSYNYTYDDLGNYTIHLVYVDEKNKSSYAPDVQKFDSAGRVLRKEWISENAYDSGTISFSYNERGLCIELISSQGGRDEITRYDYEYY
jgi:hypothetical protein